jgi:hypothetical protein
LQAKKTLSFFFAGNLRKYLLPKLKKRHFAETAKIKHENNIKLNFMKAKKYQIVEKASEKIIACEVSRFENPAYDAFLKGYDLIRNTVIVSV